eukprot:6090512-Amphidinium_carterae.1
MTTRRTSVKGAECRQAHSIREGDTQVSGPVCHRRFRHQHALMVALRVISRDSTHSRLALTQRTARARTHTK